MTEVIPPILLDHANIFAPVPLVTLTWVATLTAVVPLIISPATNVPVSVESLDTTILLLLGSSLNTLPVAFDVPPVRPSAFSYWFTSAEVLK